MTSCGFARLLVALAAGSSAAMLCPSCGSPGTLGDTSGRGGSAGSASGVNIDLTAGTVGASASGAGGAGAPSASAGDPSSSAGTCGTTTTDTTRAQADVLIVLDRTDSMQWSLTSDDECRRNDPNCSSRLDAVVPAVGEVVTDNSGINWGLELFLSPTANTTCVVDSAPQVGIGADSSAAIKAQLASITTGLSTPTTAAINVAVDYLKTIDDGNNKAILLATDGQPNCAAGAREWTVEDMAGTTAAVAAANAAGFPVYVIGIGPSVSNLNALAEAGGTGSYYPATSTTELSAALTAIAKVVSATCTFKANATPPDKNLVYVYVDKSLVNNSDSNGWTFDPADPTGATITLTGSVCDAMLAGRTSQVQIVFGCPDVPPPQFIP